MNRWHSETVAQLLQELDARPGGLSPHQAEERLRRYGPNELEPPRQEGLLGRILGQLKDPMILVLLGAAGVSLAASGGEDWLDAVIILVIVVVNGIISISQEDRAQQALEELRKLSSPQAAVLRGGKVTKIPAAQLVPGDVILLEAGDLVPADARILECSRLQADESPMTGESVPVEKAPSESLPADAPLGDWTNMVISGTLITAGRGTALVCATGMDTQMGHIAGLLLDSEGTDTPLQRRMGEISKTLSFLCLCVCAVMFGVGLIQGKDLLDMFLTAVSLAVAAIPEGLAAVVTIVLSIGVTNMSKRNAVIRRLTAVETLGCAQVICSDKTGTLTQNKMTVVDHFGNPLKTARAMSLCSDAAPDETGNAVGEPTECALVNWATKEGLGKSAMERETPRVGEAPFDSSRKMMSTIHKLEKGYVQYTKGAPDELLKCCTHYEKDGKILPLDERAKAEILAQNKAMADQALRVLAAAERRYDEMPQDQSPAALEHDLTFLGLAGMIDPIRPEVKAAIAECKTAGIRAVMITGDHRDTAVAIAKQLGILEHDDQAITGAQLNQISDEELDKTIDHYSVYARVQPEHKVRIVNAWKKRGCITAMTGDGVNDAPSIKSADIGVGMGITGTDVTKNVADMVLADDNFATIVGAVQEGRRIYDNIRKAIQFLLGSNMSEVLSVFIATLLGFVILEPVHLLWINLITDCFPALALGMEKGEPDLMRRPPRKASDGIFSNGLGFDVAYQGAMVTVLVLAAYFIGHFMESGVWEITQSADGMTMAFLTMSMAEIFHSFNMRSQRGSVFKLHSHNKVLWGAMLLSLVLTTGVIYLPGISDAFGFTHINPVEYAVALILAVLVIPIVECVKAVQRSMHKR